MKIISASFILAILSLIPNITHAGYVNYELANSTGLSESQAKWIVDLAFCESSGSTTITIMDINQKQSYGLLMFQLATFLSFGKAFGILSPSISEVQAEEVVHDPDLQVAIAHRMLENGGERHWYNCSKKIGTSYPKA